MISVLFLNKVIISLRLKWLVHSDGVILRKLWSLTFSFKDSTIFQNKDGSFLLNLQVYRIFVFCGAYDFYG